MVNVTELLSKYLKSLKPHPGPHSGRTMEALDLLSKCPGSSPPHTHWNPFQKNLLTVRSMRLKHWEKWMENGPYCTNCESTYLQPIPFKESFGDGPSWFVCLFIFLCVVLFVFVSFWPLGLCSAAGLLDKSRRSAGNAILIWKIFEGCVCQGWQGAGTLGAMGALEGGHL